MLKKLAPYLFCTGVSCSGLTAADTYTGNALPEELEPFVMTGTRTERILSDTPVKTELLKMDDLEHYNITSLKDSLKLIPSARFENDCQNCGLNQIQLLGLSTEYTAILFDSAPVYSGLAKVYGADLFPAIFVDRIEVVKGGSSVLYGPEAIAGVVNLITGRPFTSGFEARSTVRSLDGSATEFESSFIGDYVSRDNKESLSVYGMYRNRDGLDLSGDGFTELAEFENTVIGLQNWWSPLEDATLKLTYQYMDQAHRGGDQLNLPEEQARVAESLAHKIHMANAEWKQMITPEFDYLVRGSAMYIERESFYGSRGDNEQRAYEVAGFSGDVTDAFIEANQDLIDEVAHNVWGYTENLVYYLDTQFNHRLGNHTVSYGAQYRYEDLKDGSLYEETVADTEDDFSNKSLFLQDQWAISEQWELVPGIRVDDHDNVDGTIYSPRLAAKYKASEELTLRASWSTGFNAPGAFNEDKHIGVNNGGAIFLVNEAGLEEESSQTWSLGAQYQPAGLEKKVTLNTQLHYTQLEDTFEIDDSGELSGDPNLWLRINGPDSDIFVWENSVMWKLTHDLGLDAGVSYIYARYSDPIERVTGLTTDEFIKRPEWTGHIGLTYQGHEGFQAHALMSYTGTMLAVGEDSDIWRKTPDFFVLDLGIAQTFEQVLGNADLTVSLGIDNLFDERQKDLQNTEERDPTYLYGPTTPRTYYIALSAQW